MKLSRLEVMELRRVLVFGGHYVTPGITRTDTVTAIHYLPVTA
jgi:uridylate kinase